MADTLTVQELTNLRLGTLKTAVDDWKTMADRLEKLASGGDGQLSANDLKKKANAADWQGANATVSRQFVAKTAAQFEDAANEAKSVLGILRDVHSDFVRYKKDLDTAIEEMSRKNIYIHPDGKVFNAVPHGGGKEVHTPTDEELSHAQSKINKILRDAAETDRIAARALRSLVKNKYDFTDKGPDNLKGADKEQGKADAKYWTKEIKKGHVNEWSQEKLARFNEMLREQQDNPGFSQNFAVGLGADGTLQFWRDLAAPSGGEVGADRAKLLAHVQDNLSLTLANASHGHTPAMEDWKKDIIASGDKQFPVAPGAPMGPKGFQIMSSLMHKGDYDSRFLDGYGNALLKYERSFEGSPLGGDPKSLWADPSNLEYPPSGQSNNFNDPLPGFLDALGHNPEESLKFFDSKNDHFEYLAGDGEKDRDWPVGDDGKPIGYKNLGHALESATLGYAYDDKDPHIPAVGTADEIHARKQRLHLFGEIMGNYNSADVVEAQPGISASLAKIAAGNIDSINYSMDDWGNTGGITQSDELFHAKENHLRAFDPTTVKNFLKAVAYDEDSYNIMSSAQQTYGSSLMASQGDDYHTQKAGLHSVYMHGLLDQARIDDIEKQYGDEAEDKNRALEKQGEWRKYAAGAALGVGAAVLFPEAVLPAAGVAAVAVPLGIESASGAIETVVGTNTIDWLHEREFDNSSERDDATSRAEERGAAIAMMPLLNYVESEHSHLTQREIDEFVMNAQGAYNDGADRCAH